MATKTQNTSDATATGGLLVVLGIIVALAAAYFLFGMPSKDKTPDVNISADLPDVDVSTPSTGGAAANQ